MSANSGALLIGNHPQLPREIWSSFVRSGLVENIATFSSTTSLFASLDGQAPKREVDIKLVFFIVSNPEDLSIPVEVKLHSELSRVPLIAFYNPDTGLTETDIHTLYERRVSSVIPLPIRFQDLGKLVLELDRYWSMGQLPTCSLQIPGETLYQP